MIINRHENSYETKGTLPEVGQVAPAFSLNSIRDEVVTTADLRGEVVILSVVPNIQTRVCDLQTKAFHKKMAANPDIRLVTISSNSKEEFENWCSANDTEMEMLSDPEFIFGETYGIYVPDLAVDYRSVFVLDREGVIRYIGIIPQMTDEPDYDAAIQAAKALL